MKRRILIVDDEPPTTRLLRLNLEQTNRYEVREENDSLRVIAAAHEFRPDLILMDVVMPNLDGGDVVSRLKADPRLKNIPVVFLTATVRKAEVDSFGGIIGGFPFLGKPVGAQELIACIEKHLPA
jgi:putative two-component system response regulator